MKTCIRLAHPECVVRGGVWDSLDQFKPGRSYCRKCFTFLVTEWKKNNPEKDAASRERERAVRRRKAEERAAIRAKNSDPDRVRKTPQRYLENKRRYGQANKQRRNAWVANRQRKMKTICEITDAEWAEVLATYGGVCLSCCTDKDITKDHVIPISKGGRDHVSNVQPLCRFCNSSKGTEIVDYRPAFENNSV